MEEIQLLDISIDILLVFWLFFTQCSLLYSFIKFSAVHGEQKASGNSFHHLKFSFALNAISIPLVLIWREGWLFWFVGAPGLLALSVVGVLGIYLFIKEKALYLWEDRIRHEVLTSKPTGELVEMNFEQAMKALKDHKEIEHLDIVVTVGRKGKTASREVAYGLKLMDGKKELYQEDLLKAFDLDSYNSEWKVASRKENIEKCRILAEYLKTMLHNKEAKEAFLFKWVPDTVHIHTVLENDMPVEFLNYTEEEHPLLKEAEAKAREELEKSEEYLELRPKYQQQQLKRKAEGLLREMGKEERHE